ncbi:unnamed protein product [Hydatigera taeniaeformis]|uniref:ANF_receptor domain-containing protein n=1 Tax=Hydatigena taeniaeformis TaxID=6205 RepID=A0A0R3X7H2_HYDTA|nr:unnamed protein product [Hydatigera taeniaeformis]
MCEPTTSLLLLFILCKSLSFGEIQANDYKCVSKLNFTDVDVVIYIGCRIPSHGPPELKDLIEDLNDIHSIYPQFDDTLNVYTPRYTPQRVRRVIFAPTRGISDTIDGTLDVYDSATKAATLAYLGAFKSSESVLVVIGSDVANSQAPWRAKNMIELNIALGSLYPLYQPKNRTKKYEQFAIFNASREVMKFSEAVENGRRIARHITSEQGVVWSYANLLQLLQSTFQDNVIHLNISDFWRANSSTGPSLEGKIFHMKYRPVDAKSAVVLITSCSIRRGIATIAGFFETIRWLQPKATEFQAVIGCFEGNLDPLSDLHGNSLNEVFGIQMPNGNADVYVIGAEKGVLERRNSYYYGQQLDYEFGPLMDDNRVANFIKQSIRKKAAKNIFFLEKDGEGDSASPLYSTPIAGLVNRYLLKQFKQWQ